MEEDIEFITFDGDTITKSDYRNELIEHYLQAHYDGLTQITDFTIGSEAYHLTDLLAQLRLEFRELIDTNYRMSMIHTAEGEFLDNYGDMYGVHRIASSPSKGNVVFTRLDGVVGDIRIPNDTIVSTDDAISFIINDDSEHIIKADENICTVEVLCEQEGKFTNVEADTVKLVMSQVASLVSVSNPYAFSEGEDIEDDDTYRNRILEAPYSVPTGSVGWYKLVSEELDSVHDVYVRKGLLTESDIYITFNPSDWTSTVVRSDLDNYNEDNSIESISTHTMTSARADLVDTFLMNEFNMAGVTVGFHLAEKVDVLSGSVSEPYLFAVLLKSGFVLEELKPKIIEMIKGFNRDAEIGVEFSPTSLATLIENEVTGVSVCRVVKRTGTSPNYQYKEITSDTSMGDTQLYNIKYDDDAELGSRIQVINFNLDLEEVV